MLAETTKSNTHSATMPCIVNINYFIFIIKISLLVICLLLCLTIKFLLFDNFWYASLSSLVWNIEFLFYDTLYTNIWLTWVKYNYFYLPFIVWENLLWHDLILFPYAHCEVGDWNCCLLMKKLGLWEVKLVQGHRAYIKANHWTYIFWVSFHSIF